MENIRHPPVQPFNPQQHYHHEQPADSYGWGQLQEDMANMSKNQIEFYDSMLAQQTAYGLRLQEMETRQQEMWQFQQEAWQVQHQFQQDVRNYQEQQREHFQSFQKEQEKMKKELTNFQQEEYFQNSFFKRMNMSSTPSDFKSIKENKAKRKPLTYTSMVRGTEVSFAPSNIKRVLKLRKDPLPNSPSYHERKANNDFRHDHILYDMCEEGAEWVRHRDGRPHYIRRSDLEPMTKGWYEFVCRSILPTTNHSELTVERAMLIHSIIIGENINVEEIIAEQIYKFVYKTDISFSLPFPSIIAALCADAKIPAIPDDTLIPQEPPIVAEAMARTREPRAKNSRQATPPQQQPQVQHQQEFPAGFYTHFDTSMAQIHRRLDQQQEENRKSFEAINTRC
ncbi:hypothetical protein PIB30_106476 [Stylosanthes scabra]|uniref:Putative plant transposon protein domain-containing protein n=1 Tax=Stylosanthes scabra TaxID=79078 RepID=A0ABU6ZXJ2_9FABA|nr:hypothetical protein [Stylosanthes scabra]